MTDSAPSRSGTNVDYERVDWGINAQRDRTVTFLPEPARRERYYTFISVDDHLVEPPHMFEGRMPSAYASRAPRVVDDPSGHGQAWEYAGELIPNVGFAAVVGRPVSEYNFDPTRFEDMRPGAWDIDARIRDMDLAGIYASLNFPSGLGGFSGQRLQLGIDDRGLAMAVVRAWNDFHIEEWAGKYPSRIIPCQIPWLLDPDVAATMIRENAARGFHAVSFVEAPHQLGLPSLHTGYWDPFFDACEETGTVLNLHLGSSGVSPSTAPDAPADVVFALFPINAMLATVDWLYAGIPTRFPGIRICLTEGGIGWVAHLMDRLDHMLHYHEMFGTWSADLTPAETMARNFWFCALDDPSALVQRDRIGLRHIVMESDYPHADSTWPDTQTVLRRMLSDLPEDDVRRLTWQNASELFDHPVPPSIQSDPNAY